MRLLALALVPLAILAACGDDTSSPAEPDAGNVITFDDGGSDSPIADAAATNDGTTPPPTDAGCKAPDYDGLSADRFATKVVSFTPGDCAGFGLTCMPSVVYGAPLGGGANSGGLDVVSLGYHGEIVLSVEPNAIVDGPGPDLLVFENAFFVAGSMVPYVDLGEVSVSEDGTTWKTFPCDPNGKGPTYGSCAGWHPVLSAPDNGISPVDPQVAGGDPFDLADVGLASAKFVRIRDVSVQICPANPANKSTSLGFDLDAIAIVNAQNP